MFENPMNPFPNGGITDHGRSEQSLYAQQYNTALSRFKSALIQGKLFRIAMTLLHRKPYLYDLTEIKSKLMLHGSHYAGIEVVHIDSIIGSEGRATDFDMGFHPVSEAARQRWINMAIAYLSCLPLPPVQLIQIGDIYFVRDGHHRISVARALGQTAIDAEVITWQVSAPFPWEPDQARKAIYGLERARLSTAK